MIPDTAYLIHYTQRFRDGNDHDGAQYVETQAELIGFLLNLPGDGSFVVKAVSEVPVRGGAA